MKPSGDVRKLVDAIHEVKTAAAKARQQAVNNPCAQKLQQNKKKTTEAAAATESRESESAKLAEIVKAAAKKMSEEAAQKEAKATEKKNELIKEAAFEFLSLDLGRKQKSTPTGLKQDCRRRARAIALWRRGSISMGAISISRTFAA